MSKIAVVCSACKLRFYISTDLMHFDHILCHKTGGHSIVFNIDEKCSDRKTNFTIEDAMKNIEDNLKD